MDTARQEASLIERMQQNFEETSKCNSMLSEFITTLANKLGIYATEKVSGNGLEGVMKTNQTTNVPESPQVNSIVTQQARQLNRLGNLVGDLQNIVDKI